MNPWTEHGGRIDAARARYSDAPRPWLDLSTGINPRPWPGAGGLVVDQAALPSPEALAALETVAGAWFGAAGSGVAALPGSEIGLRLLRTLALPGPYRHVAPCYGSHRVALPGSAPIGIEALADEAGRGGTILLANPNNPDGRVLAPADLLAAARALRARRGWLIVDEAFAEAVAGASVVPALAAGDPVLVLRSFGKFFGLAGVRLGFLVGREEMVAPIRNLLGSWPVSATALAVGRAAYADRGWAAGMQKDLSAMAAALDEILRRHGLGPRGECPLFRLVENAPGLFDRLARQGILTRPFDDTPGWLRIGLPGDEAALARLDAALGGG